MKPKEGRTHNLGRAALALLGQVDALWGTCSACTDDKEVVNRTLGNLFTVAFVLRSGETWTQLRFHCSRLNENCGDLCGAG